MAYSASTGQSLHRKRRERKATPAEAGVAVDRNAWIVPVDQNTMLQLFNVPVSAAALSETRNVHVPFFGSLDRFTV